MKKRCTLYKKILSHASFNLHRFVTNSPSEQEQVESDERQLESYSQQKPIKIESLD